MQGMVWRPQDNNLYICNSQDNRILQYSIDTGMLSTFAGATNTKDASSVKDGLLEEAIINRPSGISIDKNGDLYFTEDHYVRKISPPK